MRVKVVNEETDAISGVSLRLQLENKHSADDKSGLCMCLAFFFF